MGLSCSSEQVVEELPTHDPDKVGMVMTLVLLLSVGAKRDLESKGRSEL